MDIAQLAEILTNASPWAVLAITIIVVVHLTFRYLEGKRKQSEIGQLHEEMREAHKMLTGLTTASDLTQQETVGFLRKIAQELVNLNANQPGSRISNENAKMIIENQWAWCRDETARLLVNSILNNNFRGSETLVARKVQRAWHIAAKNSKQSLDRLSGMNYPFEPLFDQHIQIVWERSWEWAIPLYHRDTPNLDEAVRDLQERVRGVFDDVLRAYFRHVEDIDKGALYALPETPADGSPAVRTASEAGLRVPFGFDMIEVMSAQLADYKMGTGSGPQRVVDVNGEVERRMQRGRDAPPAG